MAEHWGGMARITLEATGLGPFPSRRLHDAVSGGVIQRVRSFQASFDPRAAGADRPPKLAEIQRCFHPRADPDVTAFASG